MASIRKRGDSYLLVVSMGYDHNGKRWAARQKTVKPPNVLTPKQKEKWFNEQAVLFEKECKKTPLTVDKSITLEEYVKIWLRDVDPDKLAKATLARDRQDIGRFMPYLGRYKLTELRLEHFRKFYAELRTHRSQNAGLPISELNVHSLRHSNASLLIDRQRHRRSYGSQPPGPLPALHHAGHLHPRLRQEQESCQRNSPAES